MNRRRMDTFMPWPALALCWRLSSVCGRSRTSSSAWLRASAWGTHDEDVEAPRVHLGSAARVAVPLPPVADMDIDDWHRVIRADMDGVFYGARAQLPLLVERGGERSLRPQASPGCGACRPDLFKIDRIAVP